MERLFYMGYNQNIKQSNTSQYKPKMESEKMYNPADIQSMITRTNNNKDLFDILIDQNYASANPTDSFSQISHLNAIEAERKEDHSHHNHQGCKCTKIDCLKLYCECFARGRLCNENCICVCCRNKPEHTQQIYEAKKIANYRNPGFFEGIPAFVPTRKCTCKKSHCRKKYCQCFSAGLKCTQQCQCCDCQNGKCNHKDDASYFSMGMEIQVNA